MDQSYEELRRAAADPSTDWETLHRIAEDYPEFRPEVASNPATYPELIEALAELGDPDIDDALARRFSPEIFADDEPEDLPDDSPAEDELDGASADPDETDPAEGTEPRDEAAPAAAEDEDAAISAAAPTTPGPPASDPESTGPESTGPESTEPESTSTIGSIMGDDSPRGSEAAAAAAASRGRRRAERRAEKKAEKQAAKDAEAAPAAVGPIAVADPHADPGHGVEGRGGSRLVTIMLMVVMPLAVLVVIAAVVINTLARDLLTDDAQIAEGGVTVEEDEEPEEDDDLPGDLDEARTAMEDLSSSSECGEPEQDARTFAAFASLSDEEDAWEEDSPTVRQTLEGIQEECGGVYAAQVHQHLGTEDTESPENLTSTVDWLGTDWLTMDYDAPGAQELTLFSSPTGNVLCEMGDELTCTVLEHTFEAPDGCEDGATYAIRLDESASPDCDNPVSTDEQSQVLAYGETAGNEYFACTSYQSQMSCWNKLTGEGINLSSSRNSTW